MGPGIESRSAVCKTTPCSLNSLQPLDLIFLILSYFSAQKAKLPGARDMTAGRALALLWSPPGVDP